MAGAKTHVKQVGASHGSSRGWLLEEKFVHPQVNHADFGWIHGQVRRDDVLTRCSG